MDLTRYRCPYNGRLAKVVFYTGSFRFSEMPLWRIVLRLARHLPSVSVTGDEGAGASTFPGGPFGDEEFVERLESQFQREWRRAEAGGGNCRWKWPMISGWADCSSRNLKIYRAHVPVFYRQIDLQRL
jgi:hypothetical protein